MLGKIERASSPSNSNFFFKKTENFITSRNCLEQDTLWTEVEGKNQKKDF